MAAERVAERTMLLKAVLDLHLLTRRRIRRHGRVPQNTAELMVRTYTPGFWHILCVREPHDHE